MVHQMVNLASAIAKLALRLALNVALLHMLNFADRPQRARPSLEAANLFIVHVLVNLASAIATLALRLALNVARKICCSYL